MKEIPRIPTSNDELVKSIELMRRQAELIAEASKLIAAQRKASYDAHIAAGFTPEQALILCQRLT